LKQLLDSDLELVVESNFIYLPLLFDPEIENEIQTVFRSKKQIENSVKPDLKTIIKVKDKYFVKALNLPSLLENYEVINAYDYKRLRNDCLLKYQLTDEVDGIFLDETLKIILFQIMPHFIKKNSGLTRKKFNDKEILDLINRKINIPARYYKNAETFKNLAPLKNIIENLEIQTPVFKPPGNGILTGRKLRDWFHNAVQAKILKSERHRIAKSLKVREQFNQTKPEHIAILLYISDMGALEIDGFGFTRHNSYKGEYFVYKRTKEFVLTDYYARSYLFPECSVAVSTYLPFRPFVMEKYKHPFLLGHKSGQEICLKESVPSSELSAKNVIRTLEEGLTALRYGYDCRRRNGYHSLDRTWVYIPTIDFEDYRI
jgi:rRNA-processing protein FCF1